MNDDHYFNLLMNLPHFVDKNSLQQAAYNIFKINPIIIDIPYSYSIRMTWLDYAKKILECQKNTILMNFLLVFILIVKDQLIGLSEEPSFSNLINYTMHVYMGFCFNNENNALLFNLMH